MDEIHILILEKDITLAKELQELLTDMGYQVDLANSVHSLRELTGNNNFDFILLDASFPEISGVEIFQEIQSIHPGCKTILCFNSYSVQIKQIISELSIAATMQKPYELDSLLELVQNYSQMDNIQKRLI